MSDRTAPAPPVAAGRLERQTARIVLGLRWIMAPICLGLFGALVIDLIKFMQKLVLAVPHVLSMDTNEAILTVLSLIDLALVGNLVIIVIFAGWSSVLAPLHDGTRSTETLAEVGFSAVKLKLIGAMGAIATIQILETFVHVQDTAPAEAMWRLAILIGIGLIGVLLALMDRLAGGAAKR